MSQKSWVSLSCKLESRVISLGSTDLETQRQSLPHEESIESFTPDQSMKVDSTVADRGLDCCCEVDVSLYLGFLTCPNVGFQREDTDCCWCERCGRWYHTW